MLKSAAVYLCLAGIAGLLSLADVLPAGIGLVSFVVFTLLAVLSMITLGT